LILGIHCSVRQGFPAALREASALGCEAMQILPYRRHHLPTVEELEAFKAERAASQVKRLLIHSRFVPNLGSSDPARQKRSIDLLAMELRLAAGLGAQAYVIHAGAYSPGSDLEEGIRLTALGISQAANEAGVEVPIWLENVPGGGRRMGGSLEELARLLEAAARENLQLGVCLDTAHAWAQGYDLSSVEGMLKFLAQANRLIGSERVRAFHLNDTRALLGSHREHHWHWGEGYLGREGLKTLLDRAEYADAIGIVETPKDEGADKKNLAWCRALRS